MATEYQKVWESMNDLEMVSSKVCSAREIIDTAIVALESGNVDKAEKLMYAAYEFLGYYLDEFDSKFKNAWSNTVVSFKEDDTSKENQIKSEMEDLLDKAEKFYHKASHKVMSYQEAIDAGYDLTADGFWIPPQKNEDLYVCDE
jgi:hypothetical protein